MKYLITAIIAIVLAAGCAEVGQKPANVIKQQSSAASQQMKAEQAQQEMDSDIKKGFPTLEEPPTYVPAHKTPVVQPEASKPIPGSKVNNVSSLLPVTKYPVKNGYPVWFYNNTYDGYFGAVGIAAKQPDGSLIKQKQVARLQAQKNLAKQIEVLVRSDLTVESVNVDKATLKYYREKVTALNKEDADQYLSGYSVQDEWVDPSTGEYYMWMVLDK